MFFLLCFIIIIILSKLETSFVLNNLFFLNSDSHMKKHFTKQILLKMYWF